MLDRILAQRRRVELIIQELLHLLALGVDHKQSFMVGTYPYPTTTVHTHIPNLKRFRQRGDAHRSEVRIHRGVPAFLLLVVDKQTGGNHPDIAMFVHIDIIGLIGLATIVLGELVPPQHPTFIAIEGHDRAIAGNDEHLLTIITK